MKLSESLWYFSWLQFRGWSVLLRVLLLLSEAHISTLLLFHWICLLPQWSELGKEHSVWIDLIFYCPEVSFFGLGQTHFTLDIFNVISSVDNCYENTRTIQGTAESIHYLCRARQHKKKNYEENCLFLFQHILRFQFLELLRSVEILPLRMYPKF